jgi:hypothetical protein
MEDDDKKNIPDPASRRTKKRKLSSDTTVRKQLTVIISIYLHGEIKITEKQPQVDVQNIPDNFKTVFIFFDLRFH